jgi:hypothetical protein
MKPQIVGLDLGKHNEQLDITINRLVTEGAYKDLSTIVIIPALGSVPTKAVSAWWNLYFPPNQKVLKMFAVGMEVGEAYSQCIQMIIEHPDLSKYKYIVTIEHDNIPAPDGVVKLIQAMENNPQYSCIGGLYFTKGFNGVPQIWGDPNDPVLNFRPIPPKPGEIVECCGTGMGFNIFRLEMFKDDKLRKPWFKTTASMAEGCYTQDLYFWADARKHGYRCAIDCANLVGHYDAVEDITW